MSKCDIRSAANNLRTHYAQDLDENIGLEFCHFATLVCDADLETSPAAMLKKLRQLSLKDTFPNIDICLRLYLTLPISSGSGERPFCVLKRVKNKLPSSVTQHLDGFALLVMENSVTVSLDYEDVFDDFASRRTRRKAL